MVHGKGAKYTNILAKLTRIMKPMAWELLC